MKAAVFLDRDGVLNETVVKAGRPYPPQSLDEVRICAGATEATRLLRAAGFHTIIVTNQPDVGAGRQTREVVEQINEAICRQLAIDDVRVCYHTDADGCTCRKPQPGMLMQAASEWCIDLAASFMVGDRWRDIDAGRAAGCRTVFLGNGFAERAAEGFDAHVHSLLEAAGWILRQHNTPLQGGPDVSSRSVAGEAVRRRCRPDSARPAGGDAAHQGLYDEPDVDAEGGSQ